MYVVITRPEPGLSETLKQVQMLGYKTIALPLMQIHPLKVYFSSLETIQAIIFTSRQAVMLTVQYFIDQAIDYRLIPVYTVGDITAKDAIEVGFQNVISAHKDAEALGLLLQKKLSPSQGKLLFPTGKGFGKSLISVLGQKGFEVMVQEVYEVASVGVFTDGFIKKLHKKEIGTILFFSSQTAQFFMNLLTNDLKSLLIHVEAIGISQKVQKVLQTGPWSKINIAAVPTTAAMLSLL